MKKISYLAFLALVLVACSKTPEQKAEVLIKECLKKSLYKPESYKPVETKVDSAFSPCDDPAFFKELLELGTINLDYEDLEEKAKQAKSSMAIWSGRQRSAYAQNQYEEAKEEYERTTAQIEKSKTKVKKQYEKVETMLQGERRFIGYKAFHNYRADNNAGNTMIGNTLFIIDENYTEVLYSMEVEEYEQIQNIISQFSEEIEDEEEEE